MQLTDAQLRVVDHRNGPLRVIGGFGSGRTVALARRAAFIHATDGPHLVSLCRTEAAAARFDAIAGTRSARTFTDASLEIIRRHTGPIGIVAGTAQRNIVGVLLEDGWPGDDPVDVADPAVVDEIARMVCLYQASFLGPEELRVHADAIGHLERWDAFDRFTRDYLDELQALRVVDWAGAVVRAAMLLREPDIALAERTRSAFVQVDDFDQASFAEARLLTLLCGRSGNLVVAGNPAVRLGDGHAGSPRHFAEFARRFGATEDDLSMAAVLRSPVEPRAVTSAFEEEVEAVAAIVAEMDVPTAVLVPDPAEREAIAACLPVWGEVLPVDAAVGSEWPAVVVTGCVPGRFPADPPRPIWFDHHLFAGPDLPDEHVVDERWHEHERSRFELACSRATDHLVLVAPRAEGHG